MASLKSFFNKAKSVAKSAAFGILGSKKVQKKVIDTGKKIQQSDLRMNIGKFPAISTKSGKASFDKASTGIMNFVGRKSSMTLGENIGDVIITQADRIPKSLIGGVLVKSALQKNEKIKLLREQKTTLLEETKKQSDLLRKNGNNNEALELLNTKLKEADSIDKQIADIAPITQKSKKRVVFETAEFALDFLNIIIPFMKGTKAATETMKLAKALKLGRVGRIALPMSAEGAVRGIAGQVEEGKESAQEMLTGAITGAGAGMAFLGGVQAIKPASKVIGKVANPLVEKGLTKAQKRISTIAKKVHEEDLFEMKDFTDFVAKDFKPKNAVQMEIDARRIAERYGINPEMSNKKLANEFGRVLDVALKPVKKEAKVVAKTVELKMDPIQQVLFKRAQEAINTSRPISIGEKKSLKNIGGFTSKQLKPLKEMSAQELVHQKYRKVRFDKFPEAMREDMAQIILDNGGFTEQRRGVRTWKMAEKAAEGISFHKKLAPGTSLNQEETEALGMSLAKVGKDYKELIKQSLDPQKNSEYLQTMIAKKKVEYEMLSANYAGATAEAGRTLGMYRHIKKALETNDTSRIKKIAEKFTLREKDQVKILAHLDLLGNDEAAKFNYMRKLVKPKVADYIDWYMYTSLLSNPLTHVRNIVGNAGNFSFLLGSKPFAAAYDITKVGAGRVIGKDIKREVYLSELPKELVGSWQGMKDGIQKAMFMMRNGYTMEDMADLEFSRVEPIKGKVANFISRSMEASDLINRSVAASSELHASAWALAKKEGLEGEKFAKRYAEILSNPPKNIIQRMNDYGKEAVFRGEPGGIVKAIGSLRQNKTITTKHGKTFTIWNPAKLIIPFINTPAQIFKKGVEATPLYLPWALRKTGREQSQAMGRIALGSLLLTPLAMQAAEGNISGKGPEDPDLRQQLYDTGWQPNSIKIGGKWHSYQNILPLNLALTAIGNIHDMYTYDKKDVTPGEVANIVMRVGGSLMDVSYMQGLNNVINAINDPDRYGKRLTQNLVRMPIPAVVGGLARAIDPTIRQADSLLDTVKMSIPFLSKQVAPLISGKGKEVQRAGKQVGGVNVEGFISPFTGSKEKKTKVDEELERIGYAIPKANKKVANFKMNNKEYAEYSKKRNTVVRYGVSELMKKPEWSGLTSDKKQEAIEDWTKEVNKAMKPMVNEMAAQRLKEDMKKIKGGDQRKQYLLKQIEQKKVSEEAVVILLKGL